MSQHTARRQLASDNRPAEWTPWQRPSEWLPIAVSSNEQKIQLLCAVFPSGQNLISFTCQGAITIDWGDGAAAQNVATNTQVSKELLYADYASSPLTAEGWRQAVVTITPQSGQSLTSFTLSRHSSNPPSGFPQPILDMKISASNMSSLMLNQGSQPARMMSLFEFVGNNLITSWSGVFQSLPIRRVEGTLWMGSGTNQSNTFNGCNMLETGPTILGTPTGNASQMFINCSAMRSIPLFTATGITDATNMFSTCVSLVEIPALALTAATNLSGFANGCFTLRTCNASTSASCTIYSNAFTNCNRLQAVPANFVFTNATTLAGTFGDCHSLQSLSGIVPSTSLINMNGFMTRNSAITEFPFMETSNVVDWSNCFVQCAGLRTVAAINLSQGVNLGFSGCGNLIRMQGTGYTRSISFANCNLNAAALNEIYTNLGTAVTGATITVSGNPGTTGDDPTIATSKGWTVSGS